MTSIKDKPLYSLSVADFVKLLDERISVLAPKTSHETTILLKGVKELADFLGVSVSTAQRLKTTGVLIPATMQSGRTCLFDPVKVKEVLQSRSAVIRYKRRKK